MPDPVAAYQHDLDVIESALQRAPMMCASPAAWVAEEGEPAMDALRRIRMSGEAKLRPPTANQLAQAADIARRFLATAELSDEERTQVDSAAHLMGFAALATVAKS